MRRLALMLGAMLMLAGCSPTMLLNALAPDSTYHKAEGLAYGDDPRQRLDVYTPRHLSAPAPVVLFFYGGSWNSGERGDYAFVGEALAARGLVVVIADYRLYPQVRYPAFLHDSAQALAWVVREVAAYQGDPQQLFVMGHSAGAYNAAMLALDPRLLADVDLSPDVLRGWIGLAGPYDFLPIENPAVKPVFMHPDSPPDSQPINQVRAEAPPALLVAAAEDGLVDPQRNTGGLARRLGEAGVRVETHYYTGVNHLTLVGALARPLRGLAPVLDDSVRFIRSDAGRDMPAQP